uniref:Uncharacterized protein n=1 Tax=Amphimedon queenslandica TaxID=400682 RepID=A0A1X7SVC9_AMPQE
MRSGGLGIHFPTESAALSYSTSRSATQVLTDAIKFKAPFTPYDHICQKGGLVTLRHNEVRDLLRDISSLAWNQVVKEPVIRESHGNSEALIGDISACGIWQSQATAVLDVTVIDSDAPSYCHMSPKTVLKSAETAKKNKYSCTWQPRAFEKGDNGFLIKGDQDEQLGDGRCGQ